MSPMEGRRPLPRAVLKHKLVVEDKDKKPHELCDLSTWNDDSVGVKHGVSQTLYVKSHAYTKRSTVMSFKRFRLTLSEGADKRAVLPFMERLRSKKEAGVILLNRRGWVGYLVPHPESAKIYCHYHYQEAMDQKPKILDGLKQPQQDKQLVTSKRDLSPSMPKISTSGEITVKGYGEVVPYDPGHMYTVLELDPYQGQPPPFPMGRVPPLPDPYSGGEENCLQGSVGAVNASHAHQSVDGAQEQHQGMRDSAQAEAALKYGDELRTASEQAHSLIYHLKRFNNWVKITLIAKASKDPARGKEAGLRVLDLACGKGGDLGKWAVHPHKLERYVASDIAYGSLLHLLERMKKGKWHRGGSVILFEADLGRHDVQKDTLKVWRGSSTSENMEGKWESAVPLVEGDVFDVVSMQFALHYMAQSEKRMRHFLAEVSRRLRPEGLFIATTMDSRVLIRLLMGHAQESWDPTRGKSPLSVHINDERDQHLLSITFTDPRECYVRQESEESDNRGPFGLEYRFILRETELNKNAVDDIPEWMIPIEVLKDLAMEYGLEMVTAENFHDYYTNEIQNSKSKKLLSAMHVFNPEGTINATEWRIVGMYLALVFRKAPGKHTTGKSPEQGTGNYPPSPPGDPPVQFLCSSPKEPPPDWEGPPPKFRPTSPDHSPPDMDGGNFEPRSPEGPPPESEEDGTRIPSQNTTVEFTPRSPDQPPPDDSDSDSDNVFRDAVRVARKRAGEDDWNIFTPDMKQAKIREALKQSTSAQKM